MSDCCASNDRSATHPKKHRCPVSGGEHNQVSGRTITHHIKNAWLWDSKDQRYFFCGDPDCDVVYFAEDNSVIRKSELRIDAKNSAADALLCFCFGVTQADALNNPAIKDFVLTERPGLGAVRATQAIHRAVVA